MPVPLAFPAEPSRWALVQRLFHAALDRPAAERRAWLDAATDDAAARAEVAALLAADADPATLLDRRPDGVLGTAPAPAREPLAPGDRLGGYAVVRRIGGGGMGVVYLAEDASGGRVALKVLRPDIAAALAPSEARARFLREARIGAGWSHPHVVPVLDAGADDAHAWLAMPFVDGETLRARMRRERRLPLGDALRIARDVALALAAVHARGVVHRDVKPENVLLAADGTAMLADFGVAHAVEAADAEGGGAITATGAILGSARYMSPEQARGQRADARTDLFAFGVVLHEALAGEPPYRGAAMRDMLAYPKREAAPDVRLVRPDVPDAVADVLRVALAPDRDARRVTATALAAVLAAVTETARA